MTGSIPEGIRGGPEPHLELIRNETEARGPILSISGRIDLEAYGRLSDEWQTFRAAIAADPPERISIDLGAAASVDSAGALLLIRIENDLRDCGVSTEFDPVPEDVRGMLALTRRHAGVEPAAAGRTSGPNWLTRIGDASLRAKQEFVTLMTFFGDMIVALMQALRHPRSVRWNDVLVYIQRAGVEGLPIVGLISFLLGLIIAFMSSLQLKPLGAGTYVASLVGISVVKELGPIMTAIVVAGRSGSAFAAEIGTMKVNEEVDALVIMGFDPMHFIALPKILAAVLVLPILTLYADLFAILGGLFVGVVGLDLTAYTYIRQTLQGLHMSDIATSLVKSGVFAVLIAGISCQRGFQVTGAAEAVGRQTTSAVVSALFLVIVADSLFAIVLHYI